MKIGEDWELKSDKYQWILKEWRDGKDKDGNPKRQCRETYHSNFRQVASKMLDTTAKHCDSVSELLELFNRASDLLGDRIQVHSRKIGEKNANK